MKQIKWTILIGFMVLLVSWRGENPVKELLTLQLTNYSEQMKIIQALDLDVAGVNLTQKRVDVIVTSKQRTKLLSQLKDISIAKAEMLSSISDHPGYKSPEKIEALLKGFAQKYPHLTQIIEIGKSLEGRSIWALEITEKTAPEGTKPVILFNGMHHARELMTPEIPLDIAEYLLTHYKEDARVKHWVDANDIWIVPMLNVDGNNIVWTKDNYWRKNAHGGYGVDINRNYPYAWGACNGSSGRMSSETYRGESPASEPETQALMSLVAKTRPVIDVSFHSYSELVLYPYGCEGEKTLTKDVVELIGKQLAALLPSDEHPGQTYTSGTPWEILYAVDGGDIDWMYEQFGVLAYTIELNGESQGFQPSYDKWRNPTIQKLRKGWMMLLDKLDASALRGFVANEAGKPLNWATVTITSTDSLKQTQSVNTHGYFHVVLNPGTYTVQIEAKGYKTVTEKISIETNRSDIHLTMIPTETP